MAGKAQGKKSSVTVGLQKGTESKFYGRPVRPCREAAFVSRDGSVPVCALTERNRSELRGCW